MREQCEKCEAPLALDAPAFICSFECTFCEECTESMGATCPNCAGEVLARPKRRSAS